MPIIHFFVLFISLIFFAIIFWILGEFGRPDLGQMAFYIQNESLRDITFDSSILKDFLIFCIVIPLLATASLTLISIDFNRRFRVKIKSAALLKFFDYFIAKKLPIYVFLLSAFLANENFEIYSYAKSFFVDDDGFFAKNFVDSSKVAIKIEHNKKPKSLVLIYLESIEKNYENEEIFKNKPLQQLNKHKKLSFEKYFQIFPDGAGSTISGIISSQCSIPFKSSLALRKINFDKIEFSHFLPKATCLGDSLKELGYKNIFMGGADLKFANKGAFLKTHGYDEIYGKKYWLNSNSYNARSVSGWGLRDKDLFLEARKKIDELIKNKTLFNLTLLTLDTHDADLSPNVCGDGFDSKIRCSTDQVAKFIDYIKDQGYLKEVNIVLISDHLANASPEHKKLKLANPRTLYNSWISEDPKHKKTEFITHLDIAPSIIEFLGYDLVGHRYGLGYSAFSVNNEILNENRIAALKKNIPKKSDFYMDLWK